MERNGALEAARYHAIVSLNCQGYDVSFEASALEVSMVLERIGFKHERYEPLTDFLNRFTHREKAQSGSGHIASGRIPWEAREYHPKPHPRQADIDAVPRQLSVGGVGLGTWQDGR